MKRIIILFILLILTYTAKAQEFDVVILNGRVMNPETNYDEVSNVGIKDGRIKKVTKKKIESQESMGETWLSSSIHKSLILKLNTILHNQPLSLHSL